VNDNRVLVKHMTEADFIMIVIIEILSGVPLRDFATPRFTSMYLHLDGPGRIPVSQGMFVRQGAALGLADDTGNSAGHHLHFSIHDRTLPAASAAGVLNPAGRSVMPNPMDGQRLIGIDDGRCVSSTNV
jgi:murein DD-endopeptidase MepM/ murein hydrolase activator NlpD